MRLQGEGLNRVKLMTQNDLDGVGMAILAKAYFKRRTDIEFIEKSMAVKYLANWLYDSSELSAYRSLLITDLPMTKILSDRVEEVCNSKNLSYRLFNSNKSDVLVTKSWCECSDELKVSGTRLFWKYFQKFNKLNNYGNFVEVVNELDINPNTTDEKAKKLSVLLRVLGKERFIDRFAEDEKIEFSKDEESMIILDEERALNSATKVVNNSFPIELTIPTVGNVKTIVGYANDYVNESLVELLSNYPDFDMAVVIGYPFGMIYKIREDKIGQYDLNSIAKFFKGTSNDNFAVCQFSSGIGKKMANMLFQFYGAKMKLVK